MKARRDCGQCEGTGRICPRRPVSARTMAKTLKALRQLCRFASQYRRPDGSFLMDRDPTAGLDVPSEKNPTRPVCSDERYQAMLTVADQVHPYMRTMLILAGETGRRIGAIRALRYSDWLPDQGSHGAIRWRADSDKLGKEWVAPVNAAVREEMLRVLRERPGIGDAFLFPAPESKKDGKATSKKRVDHVDNDWTTWRWLKAEELAGLEHQDGGGWHSLRRRGATKRKKGLPLKDVAYVGGWKGTQVLQEVYQVQDGASMEDVASRGQDLRDAG